MTLVNGTFWALATLLTEYTLELDRRTAHRLTVGRAELPRGSRVAVRLARPRPLRDLAGLAEGLADRGLRPVVVLPPEWLGGDRSTHRLLRTLTSAGVRDLVLDVPTAGDLEAKLSSVLRLLDRGPDPSASWDSLGIPVRSGSVVGPESARLLQLYDNLDAVAAEHSIDAYHLTEVVDSAHVVLDLEQRLRRVGSRIGLRPTLAAGPRPRRSLAALRGRAASRAGGPGAPVVCSLIGLARAMDADPACLVDRVHLVVGRDVTATTGWATALGEGRFYLDDTVRNRLVVL